MERSNKRQLDSDIIETERDSALPGMTGGHVDLSGLRVAVVHDFLYTYAGAEKVLNEILEVAPHADVYALFDFVPENERAFLRGKKVRTSFLQNMPLVRKHHRMFLPLMPLAVEGLDVAGYDVVISSSHLAAKGVITSSRQLHICYCHSPARFAWDLRDQYLEQAKIGRGLRGLAARIVLHYFRNWDVRNANGVDLFLSNSQFVRQRIEKYYRRDATAIFPPVDVETFVPSEQPREDYYVTLSRLVPYKRVDVAVEAFTRMPQRKLVVIGDGPELPRLKQMAGKNVEILGRQGHEATLKHLQLARGFVFVAEEDFGIAPVEAQACGTPVIAFGRGGATETVVPGVTGMFFARQAPEDLMAAVERFEHEGWDAVAIREHAEQFGREAFRRNFRHEVEMAWGRFAHRREAQRPPQRELR